MIVVEVVMFNHHVTISILVYLQLVLIKADKKEAN